MYVQERIEIDKTLLLTPTLSEETHKFLSALGLALNFSSKKFRKFISQERHIEFWSEALIVSMLTYSSNDI